MGASYTAVIQRQGEWWIGWVEEVPGVNSQGRTREELLENLRDALEEALDMNRGPSAGVPTASLTGLWQRTISTRSSRRHAGRRPRTTNSRGVTSWRRRKAPRLSSGCSVAWLKGIKPGRRLCRCWLSAAPACA